MRDIGKNIRQLRINKGMTQDALAEVLFVTRQTVSNYETGRSRPDVEMLKQLAQVLQTDVSTVLYGTAEQEDRRRTFVRMVIAAAVMAILWTADQILSSHFAADAAYSYRMEGNILTALFLRPLWMVVLGWLVVEVPAYIFKGKDLQGKWVLYARYSLLVVLAVSYLSMFPFGIWLVEGIQEHMEQGSVVREYSYAPVEYWIMVAFMQRPWIPGVFGGALRLLGFPRSPKKSAEA